ncbi:MAG: iron-sulfur cluster insertion protein ErpA [Alphaproteobacteria bacterium]|nr:iron-sulfur cluster insertion protein ErpA [Alphaproteobacteria bacterium]
MHTREPPVSLTESAAKRIAFLMSKDAAKTALRVQVKGGGCSGFQYDFVLDDKIAKEDEIIEKDGARVAIDPMSLMYLAGSRIDFVEKMIGSQFTIGNPNATSSCSCGASFAI